MLHHNIELLPIAFVLLACPSTKARAEEFGSSYVANSQSCDFHIMLSLALPYYME